MGVKERIIKAIFGSANPARHGMALRAERREAGRRRHRQTDEAAWTEADRARRPPRLRYLDDAGGLQMGFGMDRYVVEDDPDGEPSQPVER